MADAHRRRPAVEVPRHAFSDSKAMPPAFYSQPTTMPVSTGAERRT
jgi:hypothetical protein